MDTERNRIIKQLRNIQWHMETNGHHPDIVKACQEALLPMVGEIISVLERETQ